MDVQSILPAQDWHVPAFGMLLNNCSGAYNRYSDSDSHVSSCLLLSVQLRHSGSPCCCHGATVNSRLHERAAWLVRGGTSTA
jgi:hypothetical protein